MNSPITLYENGDISFFRSTIDLLRYVEIFDIDDYCVFDATGIEYKIKNTKDVPDELKKFAINGMVIQKIGHNPNILHQYLMNFLLHMQSSFEIKESTSIKEILDEITKKFGFNS